MNALVKRHIQTVVTSTPKSALNKLETDASELISAGMVTLNAKLMGVQDNKLIACVVETWNFFWEQVLNYVEGVSEHCFYLISLIDQNARSCYRYKPTLCFLHCTAHLNPIGPNLLTARITVYHLPSLGIPQHISMFAQSPFVPFATELFSH